MTFGIMIKKVVNSCLPQQPDWITIVSPTKIEPYGVWDNNLGWLSTDSSRAKNKDVVFLAYWNQTISSGSGTHYMIKVFSGNMSSYAQSFWLKNLNGKVPSTPVFTSYQNKIKEKFTLDIANYRPGTTNPSPGIYTYQRGTRIEVKAIETNPDYVFLEWILNNVRLSVKPSVYINMRYDYRLRAHFRPYIPPLPDDPEPPYEEPPYEPPPYEPPPYEEPPYEEPPYEPPSYEEPPEELPYEEPVPVVGYDWKHPTVWILAILIILLIVILYKKRK